MQAVEWSNYTLALRYTAAAMGVPQSFYAAFARWLAAEGFHAATFDYRGMGRSRRGSLRDVEADILTWAEQDTAAVGPAAAGDGGRRGRLALTDRLEDALLEAAEHLGVESVVLYGEIYGPGIQSLHYGAAAPCFALFDIAVNGRYREHVSADDVPALVEELRG